MTSPGGLVQSVGAGTCTITAHSTSPALDSNSVTVTVTVFVSGGGTPNYPNEPADMLQLSPLLTCDVQPPTLAQYVPASPNDIGWIQNNGAITKVVDGSSPVDSTNVLNMPFPAAFPAGISPANATPYQVPNNAVQDWPQRPRYLYQSFWYKVSPNFPANLIANKVTYSNIAGSNSGVVEFSASADYGTALTAPLWPIVALQNVVHVDASPGGATLRQNVGTLDPLFWSQIYRGRWHHWEVLFVANTAGVTDGTVKLWLDGALLIDFTNRVQWTAVAEHFRFTTWFPVYGGDAGNIPADVTDANHRLKNFYLSGKP